MNKRNPKHVVMIISNFFPEVGGAEKQAHLLGDTLVREGIRVTVLTRNYLRIKHRENLGGIEIVRTPAFRSLRALSSLLFVSFALGFLFRNRRSIDIVHCHQSFSPMTIGGFCHLLFGIPFVVKITASNEYGEANELERLPFLFLRKKFLKEASRFLVVNRQIVRELARFGISEEKCVWVANGVKLPNPHEITSENRQSLRAKFNIERDDPVIVYSGRLSAEKGLVTLIASFAQWVKVNPKSRLWLLGDGGVVRNIEADLRRMVEENGIGDRVQFFGRVADVGPYLAASDLFVLLSVSEGMSNSVLEAMAHKLPVLVTDISAMEDVVLDGVSGLKVPVGDIPATVDAFRKMFGDRERLSQMATCSLECVSEKFSIERIAQSILKIYQDVLCEAQ